MLDVYCGYCFVEDSTGPVNASCLKTDYDNTFTSTLGRCNATKVSHNIVWAYDFCPSPYYWMPMLGLMVYLFFFAPGEFKPFFMRFFKIIQFILIAGY